MTSTALADLEGSCLVSEDRGCQIHCQDFLDVYFDLHQHIRLAIMLVVECANSTKQRSDYIIYKLAVLILMLS